MAVLVRKKLRCSFRQIRYIVLVQGPATKRHKEQARLEKRRKKEARQEIRKNEKAERPPQEEGVDPDIAGIIPGPQAPLSE